MPPIELPITRRRCLTFGHQPVLCRDHVGVIVERELGTQPVGRLGRFSRADGIRQDGEIFLGVEWLASSEQLAGKGGRQKVCTRAPGAVQE